jgi:hypothetical protein
MSRYIVNYYEIVSLSAITPDPSNVLIIIMICLIIIGRCE